MQNWLWPAPSWSNLGSILRMTLMNDSVTLSSSGIVPWSNIPAARAELPFKKTLSQRDVPGITRGAVPILARNGVPYISIGTNNGPYKPIGIPNAFVWKDNTTQSEALVTWHSFGYGSVDDDVGRGKHVNGTGPWEDCQDGQVGCEDGLAEASYLQIPGFDEALILGALHVFKC